MADQNLSELVNSDGVSGVCMMSNTWKVEQHPSFINFISTFLNANSFRLNFVGIAPDFIFNCGGSSVAFIFLTNWDCTNVSPIFGRIQKLRLQFAHLYVVITLATKEQNDSFVRSYFKFGTELGKPTFVPVQDMEMGFEKIVKIAHSLGVCKQQDATTKLKSERKQAVQGMDVFRKVVTSIPGIDAHDANAVTRMPLEKFLHDAPFSCPATIIDVSAFSNRVLENLNFSCNCDTELNQAIGSIEAIAKASKEYILENTDLSAEKAEVIFRFFRDPKFYLSPKIN